MTKTARAVVGVLVLMLAGACHAAVIEFEASVEFSGAYAPAGASPWLTATFDDGGTPGSVTLTLTATNLVSAEFVSEWSFNVGPEPGLDPDDLIFTYVAHSGAFDLPDINTETDSLSADGGGGFDIEFAFSLSNAGQGAKRFGKEESLTYLITGIPTLTAASFDYLSAPGGGHGIWPMAAHVQGIGPSADSGWVSVPEPGTLSAMLLGGLAVLRRRRRRR